MHHGELPQAQGLYDPQHEKDACGVGFVAHLRGRKSHDIVKKGLRAALQSGAPRRQRLGGQHRRRRRHPHPDAGSLLPRARSRNWDSRCLRPASTGPAWSSCRAIRRSGPPSRTSSPASSPSRARRCSAGAPCRPTTPRSGCVPARSSRSSSRFSSARWTRRWGPNRPPAPPPSSARCTSSVSGSRRPSTRSTLASARSSTSSACQRAR